MNQKGFSSTKETADEGEERWGLTEEGDRAKDDEQEDELESEWEPPIEAVRVVRSILEAKLEPVGSSETGDVEEELETGKGERRAS